MARPDGAHDRSYHHDAADPREDDTASTTEAKLDETLQHPGPSLTISCALTWAVRRQPRRAWATPAAHRVNPATITADRTEASSGGRPRRACPRAAVQATSQPTPGACSQVRPGGAACAAATSSATTGIIWMPCTPIAWDSSRLPWSPMCLPLLTLIPRPTANERPTAVAP